MHCRIVASLAKHDPTAPPSGLRLLLRPVPRDGADRRRTEGQLVERALVRHHRRLDRPGGLDVHPAGKTTEEDMRLIDIAVAVVIAALVLTIAVVSLTYIF